MDGAALIAIDWGTTSARAYRFAAGGRIVGHRSAPLGIQHVQDGAFAAALAALIGDWADDPAPRIACGMIGSRQGWIEAPYCACPAALGALATALVRVPDGGALAIVPGVTCIDAAGVPDVMRGEETQILGVVATADRGDSGGQLIVLPGTHSKWAIVAGDRIEAFATFLTGELFAVLKDHSILGRMMPTGGSPGVTAAGNAFDRGLGRSLAAGSPDAGLLHELFGARTLALFGDLAPEATADYLSGLLIGSELCAGRAWAARHGVAGDRVTLVGAPALSARYANALAQAGATVVEGPEDAAARGLWHIARSAGLVH